MLPIALSRHAHDRIADRRVDDDWQAEVWSGPGAEATRVLVLCGSRFQLADGRLVWVTPGEADRVAPDGVRILLGERDGAARFAVLADKSVAESEPDQWVGLRAAMPHLDTIDSELLVHAVGIAEWHRATSFCPRCAGELTPQSAGHQLTCAGCGTPQFPRSDPAVIMLVTDGSAEERCLLGRSPAWPPGRFSTLAGFVEPGESLENAVRREVLEETGVRVGEVSYFGSQPWPLPASLMVGFTAVAESVEVSVDGDEIEDARWFTRAELLAGASNESLSLPSGISISRALIEAWYGGELPGSWG